MENASKALIMAGGVLIGILLISFMVIFLRKAGSMSAEYDTQISDNELAKFNSEFEIYARDDNTIFDVITAVNHAWDINKKNGFDQGNSVTIKIVKGSKIQYSLIPSPESRKSYLFKGNGVGEIQYIYDLTKSDDSDEAFGAVKYDAENLKQVYKYYFNVDADGVGYNSITGKVNSVIFRIVENDGYNKLEKN